MYVFIVFSKFRREIANSFSYFVANPRDLSVAMRSSLLLLLVLTIYAGQCHAGVRSPPPPPSFPKRPPPVTVKTPAPAPKIAVAPAPKIAVAPAPAGATPVAAPTVAPGPVAAPVATPTAAPTPGTCALNQAFGRLFPSLPAAIFSTTDLALLSNIIIPPAASGKNAPVQDNVDIQAGYTYFGQFIDHDITLDNRGGDLCPQTAPLTCSASVSVGSLVNTRTPQFDLDCIYGAGPTDLNMYLPDGKTLKIGALLTGAASDPRASDHPRDATGTAFIGDPRNDENRIVASLHTHFVRYHNALVTKFTAENPALTAAQIFAKAKNELTWTYQYLLLSDFLPAMIDAGVLSAVVNKTVAGGWTTNTRFYNPCNQMPIEFAGAAYRFGHSLVRNEYAINPSILKAPIFDGVANSPAALGGFFPSPSNFAFEWFRFLDIIGPAGAPATLQFAFFMDGGVTPALGLLPVAAASVGGPFNLAYRNMERGVQIGLPSGQAVATAMGFTPLPDPQILINISGNAGIKGATAFPVTPLSSVSPAFVGKSPLWLYILAEAYNNGFQVTNAGVTLVNGNPVPTGKGNKLGPVGGTIVAEVFAGVLKADANSILNNPAAANFAPLCSLVVNATARCGTLDLRQFILNVEAIN